MNQHIPGRDWLRESERIKIVLPEPQTVCNPDGN